MSWRVSYQIGMSELGANALLPTGGAGGLALGAWALKRGGMPASRDRPAHRCLLHADERPNVAGVVLIGVGLAVRVLPGETNLALTLLPAAIAAAVDRWIAARGALRRGLAPATGSQRRKRVLLATLRR